MQYVIKVREPGGKWHEPGGARTSFEAFSAACRQAERFAGASPATTQIGVYHVTARGLDLVQSSTGRLVELRAATPYVVAVGVLERSEDCDGQVTATIGSDRKPANENPAWIVPPDPEGDRTRAVLREVEAERARQRDLWQDNPGATLYKRLAVLTEEVGELAQAILQAEEVDTADEGMKRAVGYDWRRLIDEAREEAVQVAAVAVQIVEAIDREVAGG